jgi:hypothetical protein
VRLARFATVVAAAAAAVLAACDVPRLPACPGEPQGRVTLRATLAAGADCAAATRSGDPPPLGVAIAYGGSGAAVCPERELASPLTGSRQGDALDVAARSQAANVPGCACAVQVVERVVGTVTRGAGGAVAGFAGTLEDVLAPADGGAACAAVPGERCPVPCTARWTLAAP